MQKTLATSFNFFIWCISTVSHLQELHGLKLMHKAIFVSSIVLITVNYVYNYP